MRTPTPTRISYRHKSILWISMVVGVFVATVWMHGGIDLKSAAMPIYKALV